MKKLLCLALALLMCASLFAGCGKYDIEGADLKSFVTLGKIDTFAYADLVAYYEAYRVDLGKALTSFYMSTGYTIAFDVKAEIKNEDDSFSAYADWTKKVERYDVYRYNNHSYFDKGLTYSLEDALKNTNTPRLIKLGEAFSFTMPISDIEANGAAAGKTVKFTVTVTGVLPTDYSDTIILEDLQAFYDKYAEEKAAIEMGDSVQIDFTGKIGGEKFEGGTGDNFVFIVGEGGFVEGFEEQLVGHKKGEKFDITVTFPADYEEEALAGKEAVFSIKVDDISNDSAIIRDNSPFADIFELKEYYRVQRYSGFAIVDYVADHSTLVSLPEKLVKDFKEIYEGYAKREIADSIVIYAEKGETYTKAQMEEKLYPNGIDAYADGMARDAAYNYILVHLLAEELEISYTKDDYKKDVAKIAKEYTSYYNETYTTKDVEKLMGEEVLRLSFLDALCAEKLLERVVDAPVLKEKADK